VQDLTTYACDRDLADAIELEGQPWRPGQRKMLEIGFTANDHGCFREGCKNPDAWSVSLS
jgi:hypothetical protein